VAAVMRCRSMSRGAGGGFGAFRRCGVLASAKDPPIVHPRPGAVAATGEQERSPPPPRWRPPHQSRRPPTSTAHIVDPRRAVSCPSRRATPTHIHGRCRECRYCLRGKFLHFRHQAFPAGAPLLVQFKIAHLLPLAGERRHCRVISRSPAISANLCAGFPAASRRFQLCS
jgi:hypothetical protein